MIYEKSKLQTDFVYIKVFYQTGSKIERTSITCLTRQSQSQLSKGWGRPGRMANPKYKVAYWLGIDDEDELLHLNINRSIGYQNWGPR